MRKSISEHKTHPVCSAAAAEDRTGRYSCQPRTGNRGSKLDQFTKLNSNRLEKHCLVKRFLPLLCLDSRVQISHNEWEHGFTLPCIVQAASGGVMVWRISSWHFLGPLVPSVHHFNTAAYLTMFMPLWDSAPSPINSLKRPPHLPDLNPVEHLRDVVERGRVEKRYIGASSFTIKLHKE